MDTELERITAKTRIWTPNLDVALPIDGKEISGFKRWVKWNGFRPDYVRDFYGYHPGYDFAAYIDHQGRCVLGLPSKIKVKAIADGVVDDIWDDRRTYSTPSYNTVIDIKHGRNRLGSRYAHVVPLVKSRQRVRKGDVIATLYMDSREDKGRLIHLHLTLLNELNTLDEGLVDPESILPEITDLVAEPQGKKDFRIPQLNPTAEIHIANFRELILQE